MVQEDADSLKRFRGRVVAVIAADTARFLDFVLFNTHHLQGQTRNKTRGLGKCGTRLGRAADGSHVLGLVAIRMMIADKILNVKASEQLVHRTTW